MKHTYLCLYGCILLTLSGCVKNFKDSSGKLEKLDASKANMLAAVNDDPNDIMGFYSFIETPTNGTFGMTVNLMVPGNAGTLSRQSYDRFEFSGAFYDANKNRIPGGNVQFGRLEFLPDSLGNNFYSMNRYRILQPSTFPPTLNYASMAGFDWGFSIDPNPPGTTARGAVATVTGTLHFPAKMLVGNRTMKTVTLGNATFYDWTSSAFNGWDYVINWNTDPTNTKGIVIAFEYDYELSSQFHSNSPTAGRKFYKAFRVPDNGSYTVRRADIISALFPNVATPFKAIVTVTLGRANYAIASSTDGLQKYSVYAATACEFPVSITMDKPPVIDP